MPRKSVVSYKSSRRNQQWGATWDILIRNWTDIYYWTKRFRHTKQNVTSRWSCAIYYANTMLRVFDTVQRTEMLWVYSTAVPEFSKALTCVSTLTYLRLGHEWLTRYRHLVATLRPTLSKPVLAIIEYLMARYWKYKACPVLRPLKELIVGAKSTQWIQNFPHEIISLFRDIHHLYRRRGGMRKMSYDIYWWFRIYQQPFISCSVNNRQKEYYHVHWCNFLSLGNKYGHQQTYLAEVHENQ